MICGGMTAHPGAMFAPRPLSAIDHIDFVLVNVFSFKEALKSFLVGEETPFAPTIGAEFIWVPLLGVRFVTITLSLLTLVGWNTIL